MVESPRTSVVGCDAALNGPGIGGGDSEQPVSVASRIIAKWRSVLNNFDLYLKKYAAAGVICIVPANLRADHLPTSWFQMETIWATREGSSILSPDL
ncbi:hypothetical protein CA54_07250 [Symmachiella macrocystis]|uniref:Uncharacterized protein n=1 Tax=Symmachiella macrocystis TaxID=2527985 RepID=A0A5C6BIA1_9PLAN|nr:hypothetical protein CA54_07250 [Symmachiella macrocystis]